MVAVRSQGLPMRTNPPCIGMPPGGMRAQASCRCSAQAVAVAGSAVATASPAAWAEGAALQAARPRAASKGRPIGSKVIFFMTAMIGHAPGVVTLQARPSEPAMSSTMPILTRDHGRIRVLQLARPPVNALNDALCGAIVDAVQAAVDDGAEALLAGGEKVFSAGLDVPWLMSLGDDREALTAAWNLFFDAARVLAASPIPVVAAIGGHCPAGGCVLALCCDYRVMADAPLQIGLNELEVGLTVPESIQHLLRRVVGAHRAERLLLGGRMVPNTQALAVGLVDELVPAQQLDTRALQWLQQLLALPRAPMLATRAVARADLATALAPEHFGLAQRTMTGTSPTPRPGCARRFSAWGK